MLRRSARLLNAAQSAKSNANNFHVSVKLDKLVFDRKAKQFYILVDAAKAFVEYKRVDSRTLDLTLTKVPESLRGKGIGQILAKEVFEFCLAHEIKYHFLANTKMRPEVRDSMAKVFYYCRERYYSSMQLAALEGLKKFTNDSTFRLYYGFSLILGRRVQEGIRELDSLINDLDVKLGATLALIYAHRQCSTVDREALLQLDSKLKEERKQANESNLYHASAILLHTGRPDKAREYIDKLLKLNHESVDGLVLKGWVEITAGKEGKIQDASHMFDTAIKLSNPRNIDAVLGKARFRELQNDYEGSIAVLNQLIVTFPSLTFPLVEKMKNQLALLDWDQAVETANRILSVDLHCLEALKAKLLTIICRDGNYEEAVLSMHRYFSEIEKAEPKNADLFLESAQLFSRICGRNSYVLIESFRFAEKAAQLEPSNPETITELGYQCFLQGKIKEATKYYRNATKLDDSSVLALTKFTQCQLMDAGTRDQAIQQVEFLREVQGSQQTPELLMMSAQLVPSDTDKALNYLNDAVDSHFRTLRGLPYGAKYLKNLDPDFLLQIVKEYLSHTPVQPATNVHKNSFVQGQPLPLPLKQSLTILEAVTKACPGLLEGLFQLAKVQFLSGDLKAAIATLQHILDDIDAAYANAHLLMAQIQIQQGNYQRAEQSLEVGLSYNFKVRDYPLYHFITALIQKKQGQVNECIQTLKTALALSGFKLENGRYVQEDIAGSQDLSSPDKVSLFLELAEAYRVTNMIDDATKVMQEAIVLFKGTSDEGRITVANADLALHRGDTKMAIDILQTVKPNHPYYQQAHCKMADIHLHHRKDRRAFAESFRELVENAPGSQSYVMLGDAYMSIQEPDRAIEAYEQALKRNPRDSILACKMGKALIKTHQYGKAINYYKEAVKGDENSDLKLDMSELFMKLGQYDKAEKVIMQELESRNDFNDIQIFMIRTKLLLLLARVREKSGNTQAALATLQEAHNNQSRVLKRASVDERNETQKQVAASICQQMADHASTLRDYDSAIQYYKEALIYKPTDKLIMVALAKLYMQVNDLEQCQSTCMALLKMDADNEAASIMMADLAFRRVDFETAAFHFQQLLSRRPDYWTALARLVEVLRRTGNLQDVPQYLSKAQVACARSNQEAGLAYCQGLYEWYSGNTNEALRQFNNARRDQEWGQQAIYNMIEICLNPDDETLGSESFPDTDDEYMRDSREMALRTAERLLKELKPRPGGGDEVFNHRLLANFLLLATRQKSNVERALQDFTTLATMDVYRDHVGIALGLATAYMMLKQTPRARNQLKRVAKNIWNFEDAEYLERCWLLLADIYIQNGKYDMASELLKRVLQHNKGCTKAYEYAGFVSEKEQSYREAATQYEKAWKFGGFSNPAIGYKLAFNYMKGKRYADAIDVCQQVLKVQPDYPRIRKEILDKCRNNIRT